MDRLPTIDELANGLATFQSRIESFSARYEYQMTWDDAVADAGLLHGSVVSGSYFFAMQGEKRYRKNTTRGISADGVETRSSRDEAFDGVETRTRLGTRKVQIRTGHPSDSGNAISSSIGWPTNAWDREQIATDSANAVFFPSILRTGSWRITKDRVPHIEQPVVLAANQGDKVRAWFDMTLGPCLVNLEIDNPWLGIERQTRVLRDFEHFDQQISFPRFMQTESVVFDPKTLRPIGLRTSTVNVSEYCVNDVDDALFHVPIVDGQRVFRTAS